MDPDDRLTEEIRGELHRSLTEMRMRPEFREQLKGKLVETPEPWWRRRWLGSWPAAARHPGALAGVAVAAVALAVAIPLLTFHAAPTSGGRQYLVLIPPGPSRDHAALAAPATCPSGTVHLAVVPVRATLTSGQSAIFKVSVTGSSCSLGATITGPSKAAVSISRLPTKTALPDGMVGAEYQVIWTGKSAVPSGSSSEGAGKLAPGGYTLTLNVPPSQARASISIQIIK